MPKKKSQAPVNNSLITNFFAKGNASETNVCTQQEKPDSETNKFYSDCLSENIFEDDSCARVSCINKKVELKQKIESAKTELNRIQRATSVVKEICDEKDKVIHSLQMSNVISPDNETITVRHDITEANDSSKPSPFQDFAHLFTEEHLTTFRSIDEAISSDSTFILHVTRSIYGRKLNELQHITIKGKGKNNSKKEMDADTLKTITNMFGERIHALKISEPEKNNRLKRLNMLLNRAITNINSLTSKKK